jgi:hypothetical protein
VHGRIEISLYHVKIFLLTTKNVTYPLTTFSTCFEAPKSANLMHPFLSINISSLKYENNIRSSVETKGTEDFIETILDQFSCLYILV